MHSLLRSTLFTTALALGSVTSQAAIQNANLGGTTSYDGWENITAANNPGYPGFGDSTAWPHPIESNAAGSGDANLTKVANGTLGAPSPLGASVYFGGFASNANAFGGTLGVNDATPLAGLSTLLFQIEIGEGIAGYDFYNHAAPVLRINNGSAISANYFALLSTFQSGAFDIPGDDPDLGAVPVFQNTYAYQWDIAGYLAANPGTINSLSIEFSGAQHAQVYALRLDQSTAVWNSLAVVPEPGSPILISAAFLGLGLTLRRRR